MRWAVCCLLIQTIVRTQITMPLHSHQPPEHYPRHLSHHMTAPETYPLISKRIRFALSLVVEGFTYNMTIDTGSSDFFIKGQGMKGEPQTKFQCTICQKENKKQTLGYSDGSVDAYHYEAIVELGSHKFKQNILVAYHTTSRGFQKMGGIVGLSFQADATNKNPNFVNTLINEKIIEHYVLGVKLNFRSPNSSFITFGGYDEKYIDSRSKLVYYNIAENYSTLTLATKSIGVGNETFEVKIALLDTGTTTIAIPVNYTDQILSQFNAKSNECIFKEESGTTQYKQLVCAIKDFSELPILSINIGSQEYPITKEHYISRCKPLEESVYQCTMNLESVRSSYAYLGDAFFMRYYAVFDLENKRIGLAKNDDNTTLQDILKLK